MQKQMIVHWAAWVCVTIFSAGVQAQPLVIAVDNANPPFMYAEADHAAGLYPAMLKLIFQNMGTVITVEAYPWKRTLNMGKTGATAIGGIYKTPARLKIFDYSDPIFSERLALFINRDKFFHFSGIQDLTGKRVGVLLGWSYGQAFDQARQKKLFYADEVKSDEINLRKLAQGRLDCTVVIELAGREIMARKTLGNRIAIAKTPVAINDTYLVFAKSSGNKPILERFNITLDRMKRDGTYDRFIKDFFSAP